jgi:predicted nucleotidyltransferase
MLSVASDRPLAVTTVEILRHVDRVAHEQSIDYFVTGAMARDIVLYGVFGVDAGRGTLDVDLAIAVDSWAQFDTVKSRLIGTGAFTSDAAAIHRLLYEKRSGKTGYPVDLLPFGGIEQQPNKIVWPPDLSVVMNVAGYREAFAAALEVEIEPGFFVRVTSLPALGVLKLFAWNDRGAGNPKDAIDLATLLRQYGVAGNEDRLFGEESALLEAVRYDVDVASPRLLGKDAARIMTSDTLHKVLALLNDSEQVERLHRDMARASRSRDDAITLAESLVAQFKIGLQSGKL